jgi:hypothetical protein
MMRRSFTALSLLALAATPLAAQMNHADPDNKAAGGALPAGWTGRTDNASAKLSDAKFVVMAPGYHVTSGPAAIYWRTANNVTGPFTATATFNQTKAPMHPEAYGVFFGGKTLDAPDQSYFYFLVRGDGKFMVKHRAGKEVHTIMDWTDNAAVRKQDASGKASNTLIVDASRPDSTRLRINGTQVAGLALGATDGVVGLRVNHNLDVHVAEFAITPRKAVVGQAPAPVKKAAAKVAKAKA